MSHVRSVSTKGFFEKNGQVAPAHSSIQGHTQECMPVEQQYNDPLGFFVPYWSIPNKRPSSYSNALHRKMHTEKKLQKRWQIYAILIWIRCANANESVFAALF